MEDIGHGKARQVGQVGQVGQVKGLGLSDLAKFCQGTGGHPTETSGGAIRAMWAVPGLMHFWLRWVQMFNVAQPFTGLFLQTHSHVSTYAGKHEKHGVQGKGDESVHIEVTNILRYLSH